MTVAPGSARPAITVSPLELIRTTSKLGKFPGAAVVGLSVCPVAAGSERTGGGLEVPRTFSASCGCRKLRAMATATAITPATATKAGLKNQRSESRSATRKLMAQT
jgi:hypothetical protein